MMRPDGCSLTSDVAVPLAITVQVEGGRKQAILFCRDTPAEHKNAGVENIFERNTENQLSPKTAAARKQHYVFLKPFVVKMKTSHPRRCKRR
mmetsp:Transcript_11112/g.22955  ORF Transcript_11112/g.22955 Transcript_11112/m.22955 type:complete len:92 (+) Transcript_11112:174-449(+)